MGRRSGRGEGLAHTMRPMLSRPPLTLWRFILADFWRLLLITTAVLVTVIAFAAAVQPLADGKLPPSVALKFMAMAVVPMLQYAVPFAAAFAATLTFHRMAQDNELPGAYAGGVAHHTLLVPILGSGLVLMGVLSGLHELVIPRVMRSMDRMVVVDAPRMVVNTINAGQPLEMDGWMIHADSVHRVGPDPRARAYETLLLKGLLATRIANSGAVEQELSAEHGWVWFRSGDDDGLPESVRTTEVVLQVENAVIVAPGEGVDVQSGRAQKSWSIRDRIDDNPKFLTAAELARVPENPDILSVIDQRRRNLAYHLAERATTARVASELGFAGKIELSDGRRTIVVKASDVRWNGSAWRLSPPAGAAQVEVTVLGENRDPATARTLRAGVAEFTTRLGDDRYGGELTLSLVLREVAILNRALGAAAEAKEQTFTGLVVPDSPLHALLAMSSEQLLARTDEINRGRREPDAFLQRPAEELRRRLVSIQREVTGQRHERLAMSAACFVMVAVGAVTAMHLGPATPLVVYLWAFFPALLSVITVRAGERMVQKFDTPGLLLLWSAIIGLAAYAVVTFVSVRRH